MVRTHTVGELQFAYLGSAQLSRLASIDYTANTYAVNSQCTPVTTKCKMGYIEDGVGARYDCPFEFAGTAYTNVGAANSVTMSYFTDSSGQNNDTDSGFVSNPYYYAAVAVVNMRNPPSPALMNDPEIVGGMHGGSTIIAVWCNATVYDLEYTTVNGTITRFITKLSNDTITKLLQATQRRTEVGDANLVQAASVAGLGGTAQSISDQFALSYSETALAVASGAFEPRAATESQLRTQILVARVPKAPLGFLVLMNLLLAVLGIVLALIAWKSVQHGDTGEIQARLSIPAMVASHFECARVCAPVKKVEDMFEESHGELGPRIGFLKTAEGAWVFDRQPARSR
jgi:hypothetical protein